MELDNIIYVILIIALFVISLLGNPRKKKITVPLSVDKETNYSLNDFEKILERKHEYIKEEQNETEEIVAKEQAEVADEHVICDGFPKKSDKKEDNEINDGFDVNSAIIYSTILERKKFRH
jgi:hypothetical protein